MNWPIGWKLKRIAKKADPQPLFVRHLEQRFRSEIGHPMWWIQRWKWSIASCSIVMLTFSGTGVYAYTSDEVLPDHPLYVLREGIERVEETVALTSASKAKVQIKQIDRRLHERQVMNAKKKPVTRKQVGAFEGTVQKTVDASTNLPEEARAQVKIKLQQAEERHQKLLKEAGDDSDSDEEKIELKDMADKEREHVARKIRSLDIKHKGGRPNQK